MKKNIFRIIILCFFLGGTSVFLFYKGYLRLNYPSEKEFPVKGIDISHHQKNIDWQKLKSENLSFVFIKATEGGDFVDPDFKNNWQNAKASGYTIGAYHFYRICKSSLEQSENLIRVVPNDSGSLPPVIDLEFGGNCKTEKTREQITFEMRDLVQRIKEHYGQFPILYSTNEFYKEYLIKDFDDCPIWIRDINSKPSLAENRKWTFWQYANKGHLNGIEGFVDLNVFNGSKEEFKKLLGGS
ncbi:MAG: glycoside hydrolase family 25 protein [Bacteroidia bacterium]|nr:glycoside hydrolase family 25 protein [Bacteroidia bacterium]